MTPQQRTRDNLTARGYLVGTVEKKKKFPDKKKGVCPACGRQQMIEVSEDLWNVFDMIAVMPMPTCVNYPPTVFVQTTTRTNHSTRRNKILSSMEARLVLLSGAKILIQSWSQEGAEGSRWRPCDEWIGLDQFKKAVSYPDTVAQLVEIRRKAKKPDLPPGSTLPLSTVDWKNLPF